MTLRADAIERAWEMLRALPKIGVQFRREVVIAGHKVDFANVKRGFVVEIGGAFDVVREADLRRAGMLVWRIEPAEVFKSHWIGEVERLVAAMPERGGAHATITPRAPLPAAEKDAPFWKTKSLYQMTEAEWESLCDGCGKCCLIGLEDEETGIVHLTDVSCKLLDGQTCRCTDYENRKSKVHDCVKLTPQNVPDLYWLPKTCAYRLVAQGDDLKWWHPLVSGDPETVHAANVSVRGKVRREKARQSMKSLIEAITTWPEAEEK
jgi:uncharacterized cysteine cluster protein YcgN (CxxCxxCC family)/very-short-patch-repair endonuclease